MVGAMSHVKVSCDSCLDERGRPMSWLQTCTDCTLEFVARHGEQFPDHILAIQNWFNAEPFLVPRGTQRLTQRKVPSGW